MTRAYDLNWIGREFGMPASSLVEPNAPVEVIHDSATRRIVDLTATSVEKLQRGLQMLYEAREILAEVEREFEWRLEARQAAYSIDEVCNG